MTGKSLLQRGKNRQPLLAQRREIAADTAETDETLGSTEATRDLLLHLDHAQITLGQIVIEGHGEIEQQLTTLHWVKVEVLWLHDGWGKEEIHYKRKKGSSKQWSDEEDTIILANYETMPRAELMELLPDRGWEAIRQRGNKTHNLIRKIGEERHAGREGEYDSSSDRAFVQEKGIKQEERTKW